MDKTHQLLQSLKATVDPAAAGNAISQAVTPTPGGGLSSTMDFFTAIVMSLVNNPLFYIKVLAVLALTVMIVMVSITLITDG